MPQYTTMVFDVGGTLLRLDLDKLARAYLRAGAAAGVALDFERTRAVLQALELELPARSQQRPISLEQGFGSGFWDEFYAEGFRRLGVGKDMSAAVVDIRERFQRAEFETLFDDVKPTLAALAARGVTLGILSNFSPNCEDVLRQVGIHAHFAFFVVSALAGIEKPDPRIFDLVVRAANRPRSEIVYIGDSVFHDAQGAAAAGLTAILVDRTNRYQEFSGVRVRDLTELLAYAREQPTLRGSREIGRENF
ncbi:MAG: HAD-IA family hydrolase [Chloroflexi bacterium]|nr:HAD-IA family hydrolase [Chloroflexota bacterium]